MLQLCYSSVLPQWLLKRGVGCKHVVHKSFLALAYLQENTFRNCTFIAYTIQKRNTVVTDIRDNLEQCLEKLDEFTEEEMVLPFDAKRSADGQSLLIAPKATNLPATQQFKNICQLSEKQRRRAEKCLTVHRDEFKVIRDYQDKQAVKRVKEQLLPSMKLEISDRLDSMNDPEFKATNFIDHLRWNYDENTYAIDDIKPLAAHFSNTLSHADFKLNAATFKFEQIKKLVKFRFQHFKHSAFYGKQSPESIITNSHRL